MKWIYKTEGIGQFLCFDVNEIKLKIHIVRKRPDPHLISFSDLTDDLPCCWVNRWERLPRLTVYEIIVDENLWREHNRCNKRMQNERNNTIPIIGQPSLGHLPLRNSLDPLELRASPLKYDL